MTEAVGWVAQIQHPGGEWISFTQWKREEDAIRQAQQLGRDRGLPARVMRVDWTVAAEYEGADR